MATPDADTGTTPPVAAAPDIAAANEPASERRFTAPPGFSLAQTCAPVAWAGGRWPDDDWREGQLIRVGWERERIVWRAVRQTGHELLISGTAAASGDQAFLRDVCGIDESCPPFADPVLDRLRHTFGGLRPYADGALVTGVLTSIIGQSISVAAAATTEWKLAVHFAAPLSLAGREFLPFPRVDQLADASPALIRQSGVTWRRAEALVAIARAAADGLLPADELARTDLDEARRRLRALPMVGPWTAESALLWGLGVADAHPTGDVALLRAARQAFAQPDLDLKGLDRLAEAWRPARAWAARLLWTDLLGVAE